MADTRTQPEAGAELPDVDLAAGVPGGVTAVIRNLDGRRVVWIEFEESETAPPLRSPMTDVMLTGAQAALEERLPLVMVVNSAGADIAEGIAGQEDDVRGLTGTVLDHALFDVLERIGAAGVFGQ